MGDEQSPVPGSDLTCVIHTCLYGTPIGLWCPVWPKKRINAALTAALHLIGIGPSVALVFSPVGVIRKQECPDVKGLSRFS